MTKKGKFRILSYLIEDELIFYKSLNNSRKIIAFTLLEIKDHNLILPKLFEFLIEESISYFSFQFNKANELLLLICIENDKRGNIKNLFMIIKEKLNFQNSIKILKDNELEDRFLKIFNNKLKFNSKLKKQENEITFQENKQNFKINYFKINLDSITKKKLFINSFFKVLEDFSQGGTLIFSFKINKNYQSVLTCYLINIIKNEELNNLFCEEMNNFYGDKLLTKITLDISDLGNILWRLPIEKSYQFYADFSELFEKYYPSKILDFISLLEEKLLEMKTSFIKLNQNMLIIKRKILFIINFKVDLNYLKKIIDRYYSKYYIYLVIINQREYQRLSKVKKINMLNGLKIMNKSEFIDFKFNFN